MTEFAFPCPVTTAAALARAALIAPDIEAVVAPDGRATYAELEERVLALSGAMARFGIRHGDHVGLCIGNGLRWIEMFLAASRIGAVVVPVNTRLRAQEIAYMLRQSRTSVLFVADRFLKIDFIALLREICPAIDARLPDAALPDLHRIVVIGEDVPAAALSWESFFTAGAPAVAGCAPDDRLLIQYTSGTTSFAKGVMLTHRSMVANAFFSGVRMGLRPGDRIFSARPFFHVAGTSQSILTAIHHAVTLVTMDRFTAGEALALMERERCTHFSGNDTIALMLLDQPDRDTHAIALRGAWVAGSPPVVRRVVEELGARETVVAYGLSEAAPNVAISCWWEPVADRISCRMRPQPGVEVRIVDPETSRFSPPGADGEIQVRGWNVMQEYFDMPEQTASAFTPDGWLRTGDRGSLDAEGRLRFLGRYKDIIRVGGENVSPLEVEELLLRHPDIRMAQVVGVPDARLQEVVAAFVVLQEGATCTPEDIVAWSQASMGGFKAPRYAHVVDSFEHIGMTASAKVQKKELAAYAATLFGLA